MESSRSPLAKGLLALLLRWLGLAWVVGVAGGCLVPQDDTLLEGGIPQRRNRPPRIVENQVQPSEPIINDFGTGGLCELDFSVIVEDPDVDDLVTVSWYLDYDSQRPTGFYSEVALANNGQPQRGDRAMLRINLRAANSPLSAPGVHLVEAVVTDTRLVGREPVPLSQVVLDGGGVIINPGYVVTHAWFVTTVGGGCP
ncbi:hypothetical protein [Hyalangium minutum]|uniref:Putative lipoprotein n=1 Tax=Hyalangium minutum TaxID=394096 RepID=A0A085WSF6_9BACT|nr:hypothetical protein [Hyalangium minutum]KFE70619.1 putative lipoprotein [Hyalangium minutum]